MRILICDINCSHFSICTYIDALVTGNFFDIHQGYGLFLRIMRLSEDFPLMVTEFWSGWFDHWGKNHADASVTGNFNCWRYKTKLKYALICTDVLRAFESWTIMTPYLNFLLSKVWKFENNDTITKRLFKLYRLFSSIREFASDECFVQFLHVPRWNLFRLHGGSQPGYGWLSFRCYFVR